MLRIAMHGAAGRMGRTIARIVHETDGLVLSAAMDRPDGESRNMAEFTGIRDLDVPITSDLEVFLRNVDVVIDFSAPEATERLLTRCAGQRIPVVVGTTGIVGPSLDALDRASAHTPVVFAPNYSQGVNALYYLAAQASKLLGPTFDAEIVELHHRHKVDSPSGTANRLYEVVAEAKGLNVMNAAQHGRSGQVGARRSDEIGVLAVRGGDIVGEHTLYFCADGERIELTHRATDRAIFARGAVRAAQWAAKQSPGRYDMSHVMGFHA